MHLIQSQSRRDVEPGLRGCLVPCNSWIFGYLHSERQSTQNVRFWEKHQVWLLTEGSFCCITSIHLRCCHKLWPQKDETFPKCVSIRYQQHRQHLCHFSMGWLAQLKHKAAAVPDMDVRVWLGVWLIFGHADFFQISTESDTSHKENFHHFYCSSDGFLESK